MDGAHGLMGLVACLFFAPLVVLFVVFATVCAWHPIATLLRRSAEARAMQAQHRRLFALEDAKRKEREAWEKAHPEEMAEMVREYRARMDFLTGGGGIRPDPRTGPEPNWRAAVSTPQSKPLPLWPPGMDPRRKSKQSDDIPSAEDLRRQFKQPAKRDGMLR